MAAHICGPFRGSPVASPMAARVSTAVTAAAATMLIRPVTNEMPSTESASDSEVTVKGVDPEASGFSSMARVCPIIGTMLAPVSTVIRTYAMPYTAAESPSIGLAPRR